jgi:aspartyl-tRNA(Asn)/glutamyl-tRNA(Gln) amidotransferase subunit A
MGMSFDQIAPLSPDAHGSALLLSAIAGTDERDATTARQPPDDYASLNGDLARMRIGVPKEFFEGVDAEVSRAVRGSISALEKSGAQLIELSIPMAKHSVPIYYLTVFAEFSSAMQRYDGLKYGACAESAGLVSAVSAVRDQALGSEVKRRILLGTYITTKEHRDEWYTKTLKARAAFKQAFADAFKQCDLLAGPTMPVQPWRIGEMMDNPVQMYLADVLTACANLAGIPAGVTKCGSAGGMPVGLQIHGNYFKEREVLNALHAIERRLD